MATNNSINTAMPITVPDGGTGVSTFVNNGVVYGDAANALDVTAEGATGTVLIGTTGNPPSFSSTLSIASLSVNGGTASTVFYKGTWTPTINGSTTSPSVTYTSQEGDFIRVNDIVIFKAYVAWSSYTDGSGELRVTLPITASDDWRLNWAYSDFGATNGSFIIFNPGAATVLKVYDRTNADARDNSITVQVMADAPAGGGSIYYYGQYTV
jgi:hypothetical protein